MISDIDTVLSCPEDVVSQASVVHHATGVLFTVPALRLPALAQLAVSVSKAVSMELRPEESDKESQEELLAAVRVACDTMLHHLHTNVNLWSKILFEWSLSVLGEVSYNNPDHLAESGSRMSDRIAQWSSCSATSPMLDVAVRSMAHRMKQDAVACVQTLLSSARTLAPQFDWMLALAAGMFTSSLVPALLSNGLKDYYKNAVAAMKAQDLLRASNSRTPSPSSYQNVAISSGVVQILTHLLGQHVSEVQTAVVDFFKSSLVESADEEQLFVTPYLLRLSAQCPQILQLVLSDIVECLSPDVIKILFVQYTARAAKYPQAKEAECIHGLLLKLRTSVEPTLGLLLNLITRNHSSNPLPLLAQSRMSEFLGQFIDDLQQVVLKRAARQCATAGAGASGGAAPVDSVPVILLALQSCDRFLLERVIPTDTSMEPCKLAYRLLLLTGICAGETWCANILSSILFHSSCHRNHSLFVELHKHFDSINPSVLKTCLERVFVRLSLVGAESHGDVSTAVSVTRNLDELCRHEKKNTFAPRCAMHLARHLSAHSVKLCRLVQSPHTSLEVIDATLSVLQQLPSLGCMVPNQPAVADSTACARALLSCYDRLCSASRHTTEETNGYGVNGDSSVSDMALHKQSNSCRSLLAHLSQHHIGMQSFIMRRLLEKKTPTSNQPQPQSAPLSRPGNGVDSLGVATNSELGNRVSLLEANYRHYSTTSPAVSSTTAAAAKIRFLDRRSRHSGDSNASSRRNDGEYPREARRALDHYTHALTVVVSVPPVLYGIQSPVNGLHVLALIIAEILVEEGGVPVPMTASTLWPDEDLLKYTLKNDLAVLHCFEARPILWQALFLLQNEPQTLVPVCPGLRSLLATQLNFWQRRKQLVLSDCTQEMRITRDVLYIMVKAKWLPQQVLHCTSIVSAISPSEIHSVITAVWAYLRATWDSKQCDPVLAENSLKAVLSTLVGIASDNKTKVGHFYHLLS